MESRHGFEGDDVQDHRNMSLFLAHIGRGSIHLNHIAPLFSVASQEAIHAIINNHQHTSQYERHKS